VDPFVTRFLGDQGHVDGQPDGQQGGTGQGRHPGQFVRNYKTIEWQLSFFSRCLPAILMTATCKCDNDDVDTNSYFGLWSGLINDRALSPTARAIQHLFTARSSWLSFSLISAGVAKSFSSAFCSKMI